jgi:glycosyltransferase involved in cell wall biosynthesis
MKEIVGDGGIITSSLEPTALADALLSLASDTTFRLLLKKRATKRVKSFSWKTFAQCVYTHLVESFPAEKRKEHAT